MSYKTGDRANTTCKRQGRKVGVARTPSDFAASQAHRRRGTRIGHCAATTIAFLTIVASIALQEIWLTALGIVLGYAIALAAHRLVDGSKSLVTVNPVWGAVADFKMCLTGGLAAELAQHVGASREHALGRMIENPR